MELPTVMPFALRTPDDYLLSRDFCSYGYFLLRPNHWDVKRRVLTRSFSIDRVPFAVQVSQSGLGEKLKIESTRALTAKERSLVGSWLTRMLRLDEPASTIAEFHRLDPRWKQSGRGRLMRSPTMFEDVIKTVTSCNVTWPSTVHMNRRLCEVLAPAGSKADETVSLCPFPDQARLAATRVQTLRARCRVGYRDQRIVDLARLFRKGAVKPQWFEDPTTSDDDVFEALIELPGIGPYAAANIMQLLGRYSRLPLDSESVRHGTNVLGMKGSPAQIMREVHNHFKPFGPHAFRSYWFELWSFYEAKQGPSHTWDREATGSMFTASQFAKDKAPVDKPATPKPKGAKKPPAKRSAPN
jgi:3-methyladenine DNA glycosylase/8-oxoguanine DNA glycosylase